MTSFRSSCPASTPGSPSRQSSLRELTARYPPNCLSPRPSASNTPAGRLRAQWAAFRAAHAGLPLLYAAFNTFQPVHDVVLRVLGTIGRDGPRSALDPTDSLVIPISMAAALWV